MQKKSSFREDLAGTFRTLLGSLALASVVAATALGKENGIPGLLVSTGWVAALGALLVLVPRDPRFWRVGRIAAGLSVGVSTLMLSAAVSATFGSVDVADASGPFIAHFFLVVLAGGVGLWAAELRLAWEADRTSRQQHDEMLKAIMAATQPSLASTREPSSARAGWSTWSLAAVSAATWYLARHRRP